MLVSLAIEEMILDDFEVILEKLGNKSQDVANSDVIARAIAA